MLLSESVVVFSAHCGHPQRFVQGNEIELALDVDAGTLATVRVGDGRLLEVAECKDHPDGEDLAYCMLKEPVLGVPIVPALLPCERTEVRAGEIATLVGFGFGDAEDPEPGIRRVSNATIRVAEHAIIIGDAETGSCRGDSGGPAFVQLKSTAGDPIWRTLGVLSFGQQGQCGGGDYVDLTPLLPWLESSSGYDLTPCGTAEGDFSTGPSCVAPNLDAMGEPLSGVQERITTCPRSLDAKQACQ